MKLLETANTIFEKLVDWMAILSAVLILFLMLITCIDLTLRYFFSGGILGLLEIRGYALLYVVFLGTTWVLKHDAHVKLDLILGHLKDRTQYILNVITSLIGACVCLILFFYGLKVTINLFHTGSHIISILRPVEWPFKACIPISFALLTVQFIKRAHKYGRLFSLN